MSWNYRVTRKADPDGTPVYSIREVYYDESGKVNGWSENPAWPQGESQNELAEDCANYEKAFMQPVVYLDEIQVGSGNQAPSAERAVATNRSAAKENAFSPPQDQEPT